MKKRSNKGFIIVIIVILAIIGGLLYYYFKGSNKNETKVVKKINNYNYTLKSNATNLYKEKFNELSTLLNKSTVDDETYVKKISELFIIDFYTLSNKSSKNDVGGTEFVYPSEVDNFVEKARDTFYKYVSLKSEKNNNPEVSSIDAVSLTKDTFTYKDKTTDDNAYKVNIKWSYKKNAGYETKANLILVKKDKKWYIVEMD